MPLGESAAEALVELAERENADLLVVGTHGRGALGRKLQGSVSYAAVALASTNVACVPVPAAASAGAAKPVEIRSVLVATDLSEAAQRAAAYGYALLPRGGKLTLLHVDVMPVFAYAVPTPMFAAEHDAVEREVRQKLQASIPADAQARSIETLIESVEDFDAVQAIVKAIERHGPDVVVMGTHGQGAMSTLFGSIARAVVRRTPCPVLIVPPARA